MTAHQRAVLLALRDSARTIEELIVQIGLVPGGWHALLTNLRIRGFVVREPIGQSWRFQYALTPTGLRAIL